MSLEPLFALFASSGADPSASGHADPIASALLLLAVILMAAKLGGDLAARVGQPAVLGELVVGIVLGNLFLTGVTAFDPIKTDPTVDTLARIGVLVLLFEVGLESTVAQMLKVGLSALLVAVLGVVAPFALGWGVGAWLLPEHSAYVHAFLGATLTATSVGITARVLKDLDQGTTLEARIILGAAVVDDVLGLMVLAVVSGVIAAADRGTDVSYVEIGSILGKSTVFLVGALFLGVLLSRRLFSLASKLRARGVLLALGLAFCFFLSWLANLVGLAPIVGAFAAGLVLEDVHYKDYVDRGEHGLDELIHPISQFLVPIFFVLMGARTDLRAFMSADALLLAGALIVAAIVGKQVCAFGVLQRGVHRLSIGIGMIPRGEVGLIFASIGSALTIRGERVVDESTYAATVMMVVVTTVITPPALKWSLGRARRPST